MAIFITGDTHGDFTRFKKEVFYEQAELTKEDCIIITGDFGGVWDGSANERYWMEYGNKYTGCIDFPSFYDIIIKSFSFATVPDRLFST